VTSRENRVSLKDAHRCSPARLSETAQAGQRAGDEIFSEIGGRLVPGLIVAILEPNLLSKAYVRILDAGFGASVPSWRVEFIEGAERDSDKIGKCRILFVIITDKRNPPLAPPSAIAQEFADSPKSPFENWING